MATPIVLSKTFIDNAWVAYHPQTSAAAVLTDATKQFVSETQITAWNGIEANAAAYTDTKIAELINGAPETLDTLKEISDAIAAADNVTEGLLTAIGEKAAQAYVDEQLALKADQAAVTAALALKADQTAVDAALATKADQAAVEAALALKADTTTVEALTTVVGGKADQAAVEAALATKLESTDVVSVTYGTVAPVGATPGSIFLEVVNAGE